MTYLVLLLGLGAEVYTWEYIRQLGRSKVIHHFFALKDKTEEEKRLSPIVNLFSFSI